MLVMLGFGSSARRGATGWTDRARVRAVIDTCRPDVVVNGASPSDRREMVDGVEVLRGADMIVHAEALAHFDAGRLPLARARRCPMDPALDGPGGVAFLRRNARMYRTHRPSLAATWISGRVGSPLSSGSAHMLGICVRGVAGVPPCPVVIYRDDGVEPHETLSVAIGQFRRLRAVTEDERLAVPEQALVAFWERRTSREEVLAALGYARDGSRWAPWIDAVIATVGLVL